MNPPAQRQQQRDSEAFSIAIHGGAADYRRSVIGDLRAKAGLDAVHSALAYAAAALRDGAPALDAVVSAVQSLEDSGQLNAGRGAARRADGQAQLDACVVNGADRRTGAVAGLSRVRNPILGAKAVFDRGEQVLMLSSASFVFDHRLHAASEDWFDSSAAHAARGITSHKGTVGAVARDRYGNLAAATSTGGLEASAVGRVGDSPILGAGTWADNTTAAISATGAGEAFIRAAFAHHIHARIAFSGYSLQAATAEALQEAARFGGEGGCVAVDTQGQLNLAFTAPAMFRGWCGGDGVLHLGLEKDEDLT